MSYYIDLFSPQTYETFKQSSRGVSGFRERHLNIAKRIHPGDKFICYMTKLSRWIGVLEVLSDCFVDQTPVFYEQDDPFVVRFKVRPIAWLEKEKAIPIHEDEVWTRLSFTRDLDKHSISWTGKVRGSLIELDDQDGQFLENLIISQLNDGRTYEVDEDKYQKYVAQRIRRADKTVTVTVPEDSDVDTEEPADESSVRESAKIQALLASIGEAMGFRIWIPKNDRIAVLQEWTPEQGALLDVLPLNYDLTTLKTIEQIDVLWLRGRAIKRAFEVEHTTAVYSGILRMADLLALQPNMDIKLHIVAPHARKEKVFQELQRPVFSLLEKGPLSELCTYLSYDSVSELGNLQHLPYLSDTVLAEYEEPPE